MTLTSPHMNICFNTNSCRSGPSISADFTFLGSYLDFKTTVIDKYPGVAAFLNVQNCSQTPSAAAATSSACKLTFKETEFLQFMLDQTNFAASPVWTVANLTFDAVVAYDRSHSRVDFAAGSVMFTAGGISEAAAKILAQVGAKMQDPSSCLTIVAWHVGIADYLACLAFTYRSFLNLRFNSLITCMLTCSLNHGTSLLAGGSLHGRQRWLYSDPPYGRGGSSTHF